MNVIIDCVMIVMDAYVSISSNMLWDQIVIKMLINFRVTCVKKHGIGNIFAIKCWEYVIVNMNLFYVCPTSFRK